MKKTETTTRDIYFKFAAKGIYLNYYLCTKVQKDPNFFIQTLDNYINNKPKLKKYTTDIALFKAEPVNKVAVYSIDKDGCKIRHESLTAANIFLKANKAQSNIRLSAIMGYKLYGYKWEFENK